MPHGSRVDADTILELTGLIYDAVSDSSRWPSFLEAFVLSIGAARGSLSIRDANSEDFTILCWHGWPDELIQRYIERYAAIDPWQAGCARWPEGCAGTDQNVCPRAVIESSAAFQEFYLPNDAVHGMGGTILSSGTGQSLIAVVRGADQGPFEEHELAILRALLPHLKRAAVLHGELGSMRRQLAAFTDHLNQYSHAFFLTDAEGRVLYANAAAREVTHLRDGLILENGRLTIVSPRQNMAFRQAVAEVSSRRGAALRRIVVSRRSHKQPCRLILMPVQDSGVIPLGVSIPAVSILVVAAGQRLEPDVGILRELFSLTPAEARVAGKLALGWSAEEIAAASKISIETVRTQIKRTLSKTGTYRQGELISLILRSVPARRPS